MIRPRQASDLPALVQVLRAVHEASGYPGVWPHDPLAFVATAAPLAAWVAEVGGQPAGQVLLCAADPASGWGADSTGLVEVKRLFVAPELRGSGTAQALMDAALAGARQQGLRAVLQTRADNLAANRFYERGGWQRIGRVPARWLDEHGEHPLMQLYSLSPSANTP